MSEQLTIFLELVAVGAGGVLTIYVKPTVVALWKHWQEHHKGRTEAFQQLAAAVAGQTAILGTQTEMLQEIHTTWKRSQGIEAAALALLESRLKETRLEIRRTLRGSREEVRAVDERIDQIYGLLASHLVQQAESLDDESRLRAFGVRMRELTKALQRIEIQREERHRDLLHELQDDYDEEGDDEHFEVIQRLFDLTEGEDDD